MPVEGEADQAFKGTLEIFSYYANLINHLKVTGKPGFIARYVGPAMPPYLLHPENCVESNDCHLINEGPYTGCFWDGDTSRDQYTGWFFGNAIAYNLVDDEEMRQQIREDVKEVMDAVQEWGYVIIDVDGQKTGPGPEILWLMRLTWHLITAHVKDDSYYWDLYESKVKEDFWWNYLVGNISILNRYMDYFGFNLNHETNYNLARLEPDPLRKGLYVKSFEDNAYFYVKDTKNAFFDYIFMSALGTRLEDVIDADRRALEQFQEPPNVDITIQPPVLPVDPVSETPYKLNLCLINLGLLPSDDLKFHPQTLYPQDIPDRCRTDFLWQRSPYDISCENGSLTHVYPGVDYLVAYWMGRYHRFLSSDD